MTTNSRWANAALMAVPMILAAGCLVLGLALREAQADKNAALNDAAHWKRVASKAYTGYLLAISPVDHENVIRKINVPKGALYQDGMLLPPDDFCATGMIRCDQPK